MKKFFANLISKIIEILSIIMKAIIMAEDDEEIIDNKVADESTEEKVETKEPTSDELIMEEITTEIPNPPEIKEPVKIPFDEKAMYNFFKACGFNDYGAAGLMGNLFAESGLRSNNLQNSYERKFNMTDDEYTKAVDDGTYTNFVYDKAGYGLAQWTFWSRKEALLKYSVECKTSIGDMEMQCEFLINELKKDFKSVYTTLKIATSVKEASDTVLLKFEKPANQSEANLDRRASYGQKYYDKYAK